MTSVKEIQSVRNACAVLEAIADDQPVGVSELARTTGIDKSAVHRIAVTLHAVGWIRPTGEPATRWELSPYHRLLHHSATAGLAAQARPVMQRLRDDTGETVLLVTHAEGCLTVAATVESRHLVRLSMAVGSPLPFKGSAAALAIAAHLPPDELRRLRIDHPELGERVLRQVRKDGWATNDREVSAGAKAVGAALCGPTGYPVGALVVCGPADRTTAADLARYGALTGEAARQVIART